MRSLVILSLFIILVTACNEDESIVPNNSIRIEGKDYRTVTIGNQTWTAVNYNGPGGVPYDEAGSKPEYGKYYSKAELNAVILSEGWRIPTAEDYKQLAQQVGVPVPSQLTHGESIKALVSVAEWNHVQGTNESGFNAYPTGYIFGSSNPIDGDIAEFWTSEGYSFSIQEAGANLTTLRVALYDSNNSPDYRFTVRFVKN
jgi:uncharacterized protein (TIGR02145 family)